MKMIKSMGLMVLWLITMPVMGQIQLYERPVFMGADRAEMLPCIPTSTHRLFACVDPKNPLPRYINVTVIDEEYNVRVEQIDVIVTIDCTQGVCSNRTHKGYSGDAQTPKDYGQATITYQTYEGYYISSKADGKPAAYKNGFGPSAHKFPEYRIYVENNVSVPTKASGVIDVYCNPRSDTCLYGPDNREVTREELPDLIPMGGSDDCIDEFCYDENQQPVGLNPDYHFK